MNAFRLFRSTLLLFALFCTIGSADTKTGSPHVHTVKEKDSGDIVDRVQAFYDKVKSFESEFKQKYWIKAHNKTTESSGHVAFKKPGKMDWVYDHPAGNRVVSDGVHLKAYVASEKQLYEQKIDRTQYPAALSFLTGDGKLTDAFSFEVNDGESMQFPGGVVLIGTPKQPSPAYEKVLFYVDMQTAHVLRVMILDGQGNRNRFDFIRPRVNESLPSERFKFVPPAGTTITRA